MKKAFYLLLLVTTAVSAQIVYYNQAACTAPGISSQPVAVQNVTNTLESLTITATGTAPLTYQWYLGGATIAGATTSGYSSNSVSWAGTNSYYCIVTNSCGSTQSATVTLAWTNSPCIGVGISAEPVAQMNVTNTSETVTITATGTAPITYQWYYAGSSIAGATSSSFTTNSLTAATNNVYCALTNCGTSGTQSTTVTMAWTNGAGGGGGTTLLQSVVDYAKNIPGIYAIYAASNAWFSSSVSNNATWSNLTTTAGIDLTNLSVGTNGTDLQPALANNDLNGNAVLKFDGAAHFGGNGQYLNTTNFTLSQPNEYWFVVNVSNVYTAGPYLFNGMGAAKQVCQVSGPGGNNRIQINAGTTATASSQTWITNVWRVVSLVYKSTTSQVYTNNIAASMISADAGTGGQNGLVVGANSSVYGYLGQKLAMVLAFSTNLDHTATGTSSNLFNLITNCYGVMQ